MPGRLSVTLPATTVRSRMNGLSNDRPPTTVSRVVIVVVFAGLLKTEWSGIRDRNTREFVGRAVNRSVPPASAFALIGTHPNK